MNEPLRKLASPRNSATTHPKSMMNTVQSTTPQTLGSPPVAIDATRLQTPASAPITLAPSPKRFAKNYREAGFPITPVRYALLKRIFDISFSSLLLLLIAPLMLGIAILIKCTSQGPVFFRQVRVGRGGRFFWCYKFRSMYMNAEERKVELMHLNEMSGPVFKIKNDPRITPIGRFIRKASIDELPQFFNVLRGDMSIVGPRPPIPAEVDQYTPQQRRRLSVTPGITCIWQVSGRSNLSFERWVELDNLYIDTMSMKTDLRILAQTIPAVLKGNGAQ